MQPRKSRLALTRLLILVFALLLSAPRSKANELVYFALQREGQASVAIDKKKAVAYIIDLGRGKDGDQLKLDNVPVLDRLAELGIRALFFVCSHPHSDHMGGIRALFEQPRFFFRDDDLKDPKFNSITVVDDGVSNKLHATLEQKLGDNKLIKIKHLPVTDWNASRNASRNVFKGLSDKSDDIYIENIPYQVVGKPGAHGRAVVTYIKLGQKNSIVDFDDADSVVIKKVVDNLMARGEKEITTFVVPHHGSRYHDIEPILALRPKNAIVSVNPENRYGHPSPPILLKLMQVLGKQNVVFTGSAENVVLNPDGIKSASFTAANKDSYVMFVAQNRVRAERMKNKEDLAACKSIQQLMNGDGDGLPPPPRSPKEPLPPKPDQGGAARRLLEEEVKLLGSILQPEFELGAVSFARDGLAALQSHKIFVHPLPLPSDLTGQDVVVTVQRTVTDSSEVPVQLSSAEARSVVEHLKLMGNNADKAKRIYIYFSSPTGFRNVLEPALVIAPQELIKLASTIPHVKKQPAAQVARRRKGKPPAQPARLPSGGMVFLQGGKLFPRGDASELLGGTLDICGSKICVKVNAEDGALERTYQLPFSPGQLFSEVWTRVYDRRIDSFYLSINPTKQFLRNINLALRQMPSDQLRYGSGSSGEGIRTHEVVTAGDIERTKIGQILWEADVAFKSAGLGFNVLTGRTLAAAGATRSIAINAQANISDIEVPYEERWCRLYWTSGSQRIEIDKESGQVKFRGDAVIARSEPMRLQRGNLVEAPQGGWCGEQKLRASSLQRQANSGTARLPVLNQLRGLAEIQNFVRWVRDNGLSVTDQFREAVHKTAAESSSEVPNWTSGIKTDPRVQVQQRRTLVKGGLLNVLHIRGAESSVFYNCIFPLWNKRNDDFPRNGIRKDLITGTWIYSSGNYPFIDSWMSQLASQIATCTNGELLAPVSTLNSEEVVADSDGKGEKGEIGIKLYSQAIQMHGGVLLGAQRGFLESAWRDKGLLLSPTRRPLFQRDNRDLHFWNFINNRSQTGSVGEHVVISDGTITEAYALGGHLQVFVKTSPGAIIRQEVRATPSNNSMKGLEWAGARHGSDGTWIWGKAVWPCDGEANKPGCIQLSDTPLDALRTQMNWGGSNGPAISVAPLEENTWLIDLNILSMRSEFDRRWQETSPADLNSRLSLIYEFAKWGFISEAIAKYQELAAKIEGNTVDTILLKQIDSPSKNR